MRSLFVVPMLALLVAGCAQAPKPVKLAKPIQTLGVTSNCGGVISRESLAWLNMGLHDYTVRDVRDWGLDGTLKSLVETRAQGRVVAVEVAADYPKIMEWRGQSLFGGPTQADMMRAAIRPPAQAVDAYLIVTIAKHGENSNLTGPQSVNVRYGLGLFSRIASRFAHVDCSVNLVDARTFEILARDEVHVTKPVDSDLMANTWDDYTPIQMDQVRQTLTEQWNAAIGAAVQRLPL